MNALLRVKRWTDEKYEFYQQTQIALITSPNVLNSALRDPSVSELPILSHVKDLVKWLEKNLVASANDHSELITVSCPAASDDEAITIIDAVLTAYRQEVVQSERNATVVRKDMLTRRRRDVQESVKSAAEELHKMTAELGADSMTENLRQEIATSSIRALQDRIEELEAKLLNATAEESLLPEEDPESGNPNPAKVSAARAVQVYEKLLSQQRTRLESEISSVRQQSGFSADLLVKQNELDSMKLESNRLAEEIGQLVLELNMPSRVQLLQNASRADAG